MCSEHRRNPENPVAGATSLARRAGRVFAHGAILSWNCRISSCVRLVAVNSACSNLMPEREQLRVLFDSGGQDEQLQQLRLSPDNRNITRAFGVLSLGIHFIRQNRPPPRGNCLQVIGVKNQRRGSALVDLRLLFAQKA